jgi:hypothetical protein
MEKNKIKREPFTGTLTEFYMDRFFLSDPKEDAFFMGDGLLDYLILKYFQDTDPATWDIATTARRVAQNEIIWIANPLSIPKVDLESFHDWLLDEYQCDDYEFSPQIERKIDELNELLGIEIPTLYQETDTALDEESVIRIFSEEAATYDPWKEETVTIKKRKKR